MDQAIEKESSSLLYTCSFVPEEIIMSLGFMPRRLIPSTSQTINDSYLHPNTCRLIKNYLAAGFKQKSDGNAGIILANSCDGIRKLYDVWKDLIPETPPFFLDVPKKTDPDSVNFFASELRRLTHKLEHDLSSSIPATTENLNAAIKTCNVVRRQMATAFDLQNKAIPLASGHEIFKLCQAQMTSNNGNFEQVTEYMVTMSEDHTSSLTGKRFILSGSVMADPTIISLIEGYGAIVVALDICNGARHYENLVEEDRADSFQSLAKRYLNKESCARINDFEARFERLRRLVKEKKADGVLYSPAKFCELFQFDVPLLHKRCKEAGIPLLILENDCEWKNLGQVKTRIEAFLEMTS